jgi:hypothetical protein
VPSHQAPSRFCCQQFLHGNGVNTRRRAQEAEELSREARQQATRQVTYFYDEDGSLILKGRAGRNRCAVD